MGKPYSLDLLERIVRYVAAGHSCRSAGRVVGVSASTAVRVVSALPPDGRDDGAQAGQAVGLEARPA